MEEGRGGGARLGGAGKGRDSKGFCFWIRFFQTLKLLQRCMCQGFFFSSSLPSLRSLMH